MKEISNFSRLYGICFAALCILIFEAFSGLIIRMFLKDAETIRYGSSFLRIACLATPFMIINFQMSYTFQAMGKGLESFILNFCRQGLINIPLQLVMNIWFGLYGLIWAQFLADIITLFISFVLYFRVHKEFEDSISAET